MTPKLAVVLENEKYVVRDEDGINYGKYDKKSDAEEAKTGWENYYRPTEESK